MTLSETLALYAEYDRRWIAGHGGGWCRRRGWCPNIYPASVYAWCPPCRQAMRKQENAA